MPWKNKSPASNDFSQRLDDAMAAKGMSLNALARATHIQTGQVSRIRSRGAQQISPRTMFLIADALGVEARWLFVGEGTRDGRPAPPVAKVDDAETNRLRVRVAKLEEALKQIEIAARGAVRRHDR